jgi:hypothetical protein
MHSAVRNLRKDTIWEGRKTDKQKEISTSVFIRSWWQRYMFRPFPWVTFRRIRILI